MNTKLPAIVDLDGRNTNPAHIAFFLPARHQETGEPDPTRTLVIPLKGKAYAVGLPPEEASARAKFPFLAEDKIGFNPAANFRIQSTDYNGAATRLSLWENDGLFQNLKTSPEAVAEAYYGKGADLAKLNRTILPKNQVTVVLPYRDNEGRGFQAQAVLENGKRVRTQEESPPSRKRTASTISTKAMLLSAPAPISKSPISTRAQQPASKASGT